jgi:hypothetical protein
MQPAVVAIDGTAIAMTVSGDDGIVIVAVHPGVIRTELQRHLSEPEEEHVLSMSAEQGEVRSPDAGAASIVWAAVAPEVEASNGRYVANCAIADEFRAPHASSGADRMESADLDGGQEEQGDQPGDETGGRHAKPELEASSEWADHQEWLHRQRTLTGLAGQGWRWSVALRLL